MAKKGKFDLADLIHAGVIHDGEMVYFVSDPNKGGTIRRQPNGDYKVDCGGNPLSVHAAAQQFLGQEPPTHATQWLRTEGGNTLYQLWQNQLSAE